MFRNDHSRASAPSRGFRAPTATADPVLASAQLYRDLYRHEVELLASIVRSPCRGMSLLNEAGITLADFREDDTRSIFIVFSAAAEITPGQAAWTTAKLARACKAVLTGVGRWDESDDRPFCNGYTWGPAGLAHFLTAVEFDPSAVTRCIAELRQSQQALANLKARVA